MIPSPELFLIGVTSGIFLAWILSHLIEITTRETSILSRTPVCDSCTTIQPLWSQIPLLGYLISAGKCKQCGLQRSVFIPFFELLVIGFTTWVFVTMSISGALQLSLLFVAMLGISFMDMRKWIIPNIFVLLILFTAGLGILAGTVNPSHSLLGLGVALIVSIFIVLPQWFGSSDKTLSLGDVKLCLAVALWLGWILSVYVFFFASLLASLTWIFSGFFKGFSGQRRLQFGPFVALSTVIFGIGRVVDPSFVTHLLSFRF